MVLSVGVFADVWWACTGFSVVSNHIAYELSKHSDMRVIYFGRFGRKEEFDRETSLSDRPYETVRCQGGVWDRELVVRIIKHYGLDFVFSEDDWFSAGGLCEATRFWKKPFYFLTPIDSLPIHPQTYEVFKYCKRVYTPNRSNEIINSHVEELKTRKRHDIFKAKIKAEYLPHAVDSSTFRPLSNRKEDKFTFVWIGRDDKRKALGRMILAYEKLLNKYDCNLLIRTDWNTPNARLTNAYLTKKNIPVIKEQLSNCPHGMLRETYNRGHMLVITSKAGGFEMQSIEAMACGLPVLVTDWNFMNETVINGRNGFKIPCSGFETASFGRVWGQIDVDRLSAVMEWCINNGSLVEHMGRWARNWVVENYRWSDVGRKLYKSIMTSVDET